MSGKWFKVVSYGVRKDDHLLDMDEVARLAHEHKPKLILAGGTAYSRVWDWERFREIADEVGAYLMVDMAHIAGLVAGGVASLAGAACPRHDHDHAQVAARPARRHDPHQRRGHRQEDQLGGVPRPPGRPADACHRRQGRGLQGSAAARVQGLCPPGRRQRPGARGHADRARPRRRLRRHRQPPDAGRPAAQERHRQAGRDRASAAPTSPATRTAFRSIRKSRSSPRASVSARRPARRAVSARPSSG